MSNTLEVQNLSVAFKSLNKITKALDELTFSLEPGKTLALLGESGCGKSITSLALMRLLPQSGVYSKQSQIIYEQQDLLAISERSMRQLRGRRLAMIFQEPMTALNPVMTIGDQIAEVIRKHQHVTQEEVYQRLIALLIEVEIAQPEIKLLHYPHQLSGGQKQRVVIAMALACKPDILIADEPTTALDVTIQAQILALLKKLQQTHQMSLLLITHDLGVVKAMADTVCVMYAGQIVEQSSVAEFFNQVRHPYVQQLLASLPTLANKEEPLSSIAGSVPTLDSLPSGCRFHPRCIYSFERCTKEEPLIQTLEKRMIRCHLYPNQHELPSLKQQKRVWAHREESETTPLLDVRHLTVQFSHKKTLLSRHKTAHTAVNSLSFSLKKAKTLALVGESGCGKTTVSRALLRLIPVTSGSVCYKNEDVFSYGGRSLRAYRKKIQIIFQDPFSSMNPRMTVGEIIAEGMQAQGFKASVIKQRQKQLIDQVNLPSTSLQRYPHQFSGGQRQRICIARALATDPEVLICDEPTSALDISVQAQILNLLKELQQERGIAYLFITHNMGVVSYIADEVLVMYQGQEVEFGACERVLSQPEHSYTQKLLQAVLAV